MSWRREDHLTRELAPGDVLVVRGRVIDITPRHAPLPEQDVRQVARAQRHNAGCYARAEVIALAYAGEALEKTHKSWWAKLIRWWRR